LLDLYRYITINYD